MRLGQELGTIRRNPLNGHFAYKTAYEWRAFDRTAGGSSYPLESSTDVALWPLVLSPAAAIKLETTTGRVGVKTTASWARDLPWLVLNTVATNYYAANSDVDAWVDVWPESPTGGAAP